MVDPHACCHHSADASRQSIACASSACDHADETVTAVAVVDPVIVAPAIINTTTVVAADGLERPATGTASNYSLPRFQSRTSPLRI
jgi:hypothetical protein